MTKSRPSVLLVYGTRPEAIKIAPIVGECLRRKAELDLTLLSTGQHAGMLKDVENYFGLKPVQSLNVMKPGQSVASMTIEAQRQLREYLAGTRKPDFITALGDTASVAAAAQVAFFERIPFVHLEAGLRSSVVDHFPEDFNRRLCTLAAALHLTPTERAVRNLKKERIVTPRVILTGNTIVDALHIWEAREANDPSSLETKYHHWYDCCKLVIVTMHHREHLQSGALEAMCRATASLAKQIDNLTIVVPAHPNPEISAIVRRQLTELRGIEIVDPLPYRDFVFLLKKAALVMTDSGGVQEEACILGRPLVIMREQTDRPEIVEIGAGKLVGTDADAIFKAARQTLRDRYRPNAKAARLFGDGNAAKNIVDAFVKFDFASAR